jgi:SAM-dependent methyltransferase
MVEIKTQAGKVLGHVAGYIATRTLHIGITRGFFAAIAEHSDGIDVDSLASQLGYDAFYTEVWLRSAVASEYLEVAGDPVERYSPEARRFERCPDRKFHLAEHMQTLLLDQDFPAYVGALPTILAQREVFDLFAENLESGERLWWNECSPEAIGAVSNTGWSFYVRLIPGGLDQVPGVSEILTGAPRIAELCCGVGKGTERLATMYPNCSIVSVDGDAYSLEQAKARLDGAGLSSRVELVHSYLEEMQLEPGFDLVFINISMHECRDIDKVAENVKACLRPGGIFVVSDFPFPNSVEAQRTIPGRIMSGIQFFEALIEDQLMPTPVFTDLLAKHGFSDVGSFDVSPVHAISYGRA